MAVNPAAHRSITEAARRVTPAPLATLPPLLYARPMLPPPGLAPVLTRELTRTGRRWQTWALRAGVIGGLLLVVFVFWADRIQGPDSLTLPAMGSVGRALFRTFVGVQTALLVALTPILVSQAVIEEREGGTLPLLALTRLGPARILVGKVLSRVLALELVVLGGLPILTLCTSLGGAGPFDVLNVFVQSTTIIVSLAAVSAFLGLYARGPFTPALYTWFWALLAYWLGALPHALMQMSSGGFYAASPTMAMWGARGWQILGPPISQLPVAAAVFAFAAAGLRAQIAGADDAISGFGTLSRDFDGLRRVSRSLGWTLIALVATVPLVIFQAVFGRVFAPLGQLSLLWTAGWLWFGTGVYLFAARWSLLRQEQKERKQRLKGWQELSTEWSSEARVQASAVGAPAAPAPTADVDSPPSSSALATAGSEADAWGDPAAPPRSLSGRRTRRGDRLTRSRRLSIGREVWSNPILWRETMTSAYGGLRRSILRAYLILGGFAGLLTLVGAFDNPALAVSASMAAFGFAGICTLLAATASVAAEVRDDTLPLLIASRLGPARILASKLAAVAIYAGPAWAAASLWLALGIDALPRGLPNLPMLLLRWIGASGWSAVVLAFLALSCQTIGLRTRSASRIWVLTVVWTAWNLVGPPVLLALVDGWRPGEFVAALWNPLLEPSFWEAESLPWSPFAAAALWALLAAVAFGQNVVLLRRRAG